MKHEKIEVAAAEETAPAKSAHRRPSRRTVLMVISPLVVMAGAGYAYLHGGRFVSTDNAYIHATVTPVTAEVSGPVGDVRIRDNEQVVTGDLLFAIDRRPYEIALRESEAALDKARGDVAALKASYRQKVQEIALARNDQAYAEREWRRQQSLAALAPQPLVWPDEGIPAHKSRPSGDLVNSLIDCDRNSRFYRGKVARSHG